MSDSICFWVKEIIQIFFSLLLKAFFFYQTTKDFRSKLNQVQNKGKKVRRVHIKIYHEYKESIKEYLIENHSD